MRNILFVYLIFFTFSCQNISDIGVLVPPTVDQDSRLPNLKINVAGQNRLVHLRTFGNPTSPKLFFLHGSYTDTRAYRNLCEGLSEKYHVIIWDQRGCGLSERITEGEFTLEYAIDEIKQIKEVYAPNEKITIIGHSWGGGVATLFTAKNPNQVAQLVVMEPIPLTGADMKELYQQIVEFSYFNADWNSMARQGQALSIQDHAVLDYRAMMILKSSMTRAYHCSDRNPPEWLIHRVGGLVEHIRNKRLGNPLTTGFTYDFRNGIDNFQEPVLVLGGSCSSLGYEVQNQYTKPHFRNAKIVEIKNAGHRMNVEQYEEVMRELKNYLKAY
ncbi:MAG: alpha/beta hydrolase [Thermoflexibacter sp.]|jgi:proline iminopeptidase|nr:alpha/beta hydrolase [Thermoflexibacter sp.]